MPAGAALVAVGGYGRGELFPYSDVDVLVLLPDGRADATTTPRDAAIEGFITACWDIGLEIGSSVRTRRRMRGEARADVTVQTALLESRPVRLAQACSTRSERATDAGDGPEGLPARQDAGDAAAPHQVREHALLARAQLQGEPGRPARPAVVIWVARAAGLGRSWDELAAQGPGHAVRGAAAQAQRRLLKLIRARLHVIAGRREDRLVFDLQTAVAETFGYQVARAASAPPSC